MPNAFIHQLWDFSRLLGLRDRLRCPHCRAVGTWKPHGGWLDGKDVRKVRRWLCKWCGFYHGPEGYRFCQLGSSAWELVDDGFVIRDTPKARCNGANPWNG